MHPSSLCILLFWTVGCTFISVTGAFTTPLRLDYCRTRRFMTTTTPSMRYIDAIRDLTDDHDVFLLDMWGVMHNGSKPYKGVLETIKKLKEAGKEMIILSNSSKRTDSSIKMLRNLGFDPNDFCQILTSGEVSVYSVRQIRRLVHHHLLLKCPRSFFFRRVGFLSHASRRYDARV